MKRTVLVLAILAGILPFAFCQLPDVPDDINFVWNPETGKRDYISQVNPIADSVINYGTNNTLSSDTLNGIIGHGNTVDAARSMAFGYYNLVDKEDNILFGAFTQSDTTHTISIGRGLNNSNRMVNSTYGTIGMGYFSTEPIMYIHSGLEPGETHPGVDIGGVSIGGPGRDSLAALQINEHLSWGYFIKCKSYDGTERFSVDYDGNSILDGTLTADSVVCNFVPTIHQAVGDTSYYHTPDKIGDMFIDTSAGDTYISVGTSRGDWEKL